MKIDADNIYKLRKKDLEVAKKFYEFKVAELEFNELKMNVDYEYKLLDKDAIVNIATGEISIKPEEV